MINVGIIGLGKMGGYHANVCLQLHSLQAIKLVGVSDLNEKNLSKITAPFVIKSNDYKTWLYQVDAVIVAVPTDYHYPVAKECLLAGKHVLLEKPITKNIAEAEELLALAAKLNLTLHVGHVERFNGAVQELKKIIDNPLFIETHRMGPFAPRVEKDSVVLDLMIHDLDLLLMLVDSKVKSISAQGQKVHTDSCDIVSVQLLFENGVIANLVASRASQVKERTMTVHQKNEYIKLDFTTQDIAIHRQMNTSVQIGSDEMKYRQESLTERLFVYKDNPLKQEIEHFIKTVKTGNDTIDPEQNLTAIKLTFEIEKLLGIR
ncbi:MAG: Oxidoreductase domain protein [candidate division TM6 bacterium GW2011_GWF2_37_49]|nr:MAG: Oxidoreductase domain protein [candidate division TM6 bacterium GW2011_GWF2_37_49]